MITPTRYGSYAVTQVVNIVASYGILVLIANGLSKSDFAIYGVLTSVVGWLLIVVNFGHKECLFKYTSNGDTVRQRAIGASLVKWWGIWFFLGVTAAPIFPTFAIALLALLSLLCLLSVGGVFRGTGKYTLDALVWPIYRLIWLGTLLLCYLLAEVSLTIIFVASLCAALAALYCLGGGAVLGTFVPLAKSASLPFQDKILLKFMLIELATIAYLKLDVVMLGYWFGANERLANYVLSIQIFEAAVLFLTPVAYFYFNQLNLHERSLPIDAGDSYFYFGIMSLFAIGIYIGWYYLGGALVEGFFPSYTDVHILTSTLLLSLMPMAMSMLLMYRLIHLDRESTYAIVCAIVLAQCQRDTELCTMALRATSYTHTHRLQLQPHED